jgi:WD40 repeat protein
MSFSHTSLAGLDFVTHYIVVMSKYYHHYHIDEVTAVRYTVDELYLVSAGADIEILIWDLTSCEVYTCTIYIHKRMYIHVCEYLCIFKYSIYTQYIPGDTGSMDTCVCTHVYMFTCVYFDV